MAMQETDNRSNSPTWMRTDETLSSVSNYGSGFSCMGRFYDHRVPSGSLIGNDKKTSLAHNWADANHHDRVLMLP